MIRYAAVSALSLAAGDANGRICRRNTATGHLTASLTGPAALA